MSRPLEDALEICLRELATGQDLEACLARFPELATDLRPLLATALLAAAESAQPPAGAQAKSRTRMLQAAAEMRGAARAKRRWPSTPRLVFAPLMAALLILVSGFGLFAASADTLPGDFLYPLKRSAEAISLRIAFTKGERSTLEQSYRQRRTQEVLDLLAEGRVEGVSFEGELTARTPFRWIVDGVHLVLDESTVIGGEIAIGDEIEVEGETRPEGYVLAHELRRQRFKLVGRVDAIGPSTWTIGDQAVQLGGETQIEAGIHRGDIALAFVRVEDDGSLLADSILLLESATPTAVPTTAPTPTATPPVSETPEPTEKAGDQESGEDEFKTTGTVEAMGNDSWVVDGTSFLITGGTEIDDGIRIGDRVRVEAVLIDGTYTAQRIELRESGDGEGESTPEATKTSEPDETPESEEDKIEFSGEVQSMSASQWVIDGKVVHIDGDTEIRDDPEVGDEVKVKARRAGDGSLWAIKIEKKD